MATAGDDKLFVHGTSGPALAKMVKYFGVMEPSVNCNHDFGNGVYCFKNWYFAFAFAFAVDRCFPKLDDDGNFESCNPCLVMFPDCNRSDCEFYDVGNRQTSPDILKKKSDKEDFKEFQTVMASSQHKPKDKKWKEFVKMAMFFQKLPVVPLGFRGFLHDCESVKITMSDLRAVPKIDKERWIQYILFPELS